MTHPTSKLRWDQIDDEFAELSDECGYDPLHDFLPAQFAPADWHNLVLGAATSGNDLVIDLRSDPHMLLVGTDDTGKTLFIQRVAVSALSRGHQLVLIEALHAGGNYTRMLDSFARTALTREAAVSTLLDLRSEIARRYDLLADRAPLSWTEVNSSDAALGLKPVTVVVDNYAALVLDDSMGKLSIDLLRHIAHRGQAVGIHLLLSAESVSEVEGEQRSRLGARILLLTPTTSVSQLQLFMSGSGSSAFAAVKLLEAERKSNMRGYVLVSASDGIALGQLGLILSAQVTSILESIRVPQPKSLGRELI